MQTLPQALTYLSVYSFTKMLIPALSMALCRAGRLIHFPVRWERPLSCSDCNIHWLPCWWSKRIYTHTVAVRLRLLIKSCVTVLSGLLPGPWHWAWWVPHRRWKELSLGPVVGAPSSGRESLHMFPASAQQAGRSPSWRRSWPPPPHKRRHWCHPSSTASLDEQPTSASLTFLFQPF